MNLRERAVRFPFERKGRTKREKRLVRSITAKGGLVGWIFFKYGARLIGELIARATRQNTKS